MKRILKWIVRIAFVLLIVAFLLVFVAYWRSTNDCNRKTAAPSNPMKAIVYCDYGLTNLKLQDIEKPVPNDDQVLVRVRAASVNPYDWHFIEGTPYIMRAMGVGLRKPKSTQLGVDFAGTIEAVGKNVANFKAGDDIFGRKTGASGGVGTFAVQIAKSFDVDVTGVCSTRNVDLVRSLGADHVIDYTKEDFTKSGQRYDVILDNVGTQPLLSFRRVLIPKGKYVMIGGGGPNDQGLIGPLFRPIKAMLLSPFVRQEMGMVMADTNQKDLAVLADLMQSGKVKPVIDRTYKLSEVPAAIAYLEQGHARGKVVITVE